MTSYKQLRRQLIIDHLGYVPLDEEDFDSEGIIATLGYVPLDEEDFDAAAIEELAAEAAASAALAQSLVDSAATGYLSFPTTLAMTGYAGPKVANMTAYNAETDSYYIWDSVGIEWDLIRPAENVRITQLEARVVPVSIVDDYTVTGSNVVIEADTTTKEIQVTLKGSPANRDKVTIIDVKGSFSLYNLVIDGNGKTIGGTATSVRCREPVPMVIVIQFNSTADTWRLLHTN